MSPPAPRSTDRSSDRRRSPASLASRLRHASVLLLLAVVLAVPAVGGVPASDAGLTNVTYVGDGALGDGDGRLELWQSESHAFAATVASGAGVDGRLCLVGANGSDAPTLACASASVPANATARRTVEVDAWPANRTGPQRIAIELRSNGSTVATSDPLSVTVLAKGGDADGDGLSNERELAAGSEYRTADTDGDGLDDGAEVRTYGTSPTTADSDGDELTDRAELEDHRTNPNAADSDGDGLPDAREVRAETNPNEADSDGDGLDDALEVNTYETNATRADTDGDGLDDGTELEKHESNPTAKDTDDDGLGDALEVNTYETGVNTVDTDGDGLPDGPEIHDYGTDPTSTDTDDDGLTDGRELNTYGTSPTTADTDGDRLADGPEVNRYRTDPTTVDTDGDGRSDALEVDPRPPRRLPLELVALGGLAALATVVGGVLYRSGRGPDVPLPRLWPPDDAEDDSESAAAVTPTGEENGAVPPEFLTNEERIQRLLADNDGRMRQAAIVEQTGWSKSKVSRVLSGMAERDAIVKVDVGKGNVITLPDHVPPGAESPFDE